MTKNAIYTVVHRSKIGFLRRVHGVTLRNKVRSCEIREVLTVHQAILRIKRSQLYVISTMWPECPGKIDEASPSGFTFGKAAHQVVQAPGGVIISPIWAWSRVDAEPADPLLICFEILVLVSPRGAEDEKW